MPKCILKRLGASTTLVQVAEEGDSPCSAMPLWGRGAKAPVTSGELAISSQEQDAPIGKVKVYPGKLKARTSWRIALGFSTVTVHSPDMASP